jgi:hypothetical protein
MIEEPSSTTSPIAEEAVLARRYSTEVRHELWTEDDGARGLFGRTTRLAWCVDATSHSDAMTEYYEHMGWGRRYVGTKPNHRSARRS